MRTKRIRMKAVKATVGSRKNILADRGGASCSPVVLAGIRSGNNSEQGPFPIQQLLCIARQSGIAEPLACATSLTLLKTSRAVNSCLHRILKPLGLSEGRFAALVTLYALDPIPASSADLAYHTEISRPAMTGLLDTMEERGWIRRRHRLDKDRRFSRISLTAKGREVTGFAIYRFLKSAAEIAEDLSPKQHALFDEACAHLRHRSVDLET